MQRIQAKRCNLLLANRRFPAWLLAGLLLTVLLPPIAAQELTPQIPPGNHSGFAAAPELISDNAVRPTDFQSAVANGHAQALEPLGPAAFGSATLSNLSAPGGSSGNPPLANAIREFIEPDPPEATERTSASLFKLSALQLDNIDWKKMLLSLGLVIGLYLGLMFLLRLWSPQGGGSLPREVVEVLGATPLNSRQSLQLVRLGSKLLLLIHGPEGTQSLGEISNPNEVEHLAQICCNRRSRKGPTAFRKFGEPATREAHAPPQLDQLLKNLQQALQRAPGRTEYEA